MKNKPERSYLPESVFVILTYFKQVLKRFCFKTCFFIISEKYFTCM
ncbi:hypothetical protein TPE_0386 [Treponema pedis str. T A4]|uniref:Uncharacterized protein n=1 Tax=Treponema pedis str. T A4 TaxID=1291379 RepID=S5ZJZ4_9SPIR|nr:hypothetical protein TPE_0386 [Treponema pedis str. T A4]